MSDFTRLPPELRSQVELELQSGERIVWADQPIPGRFARSSMGLVIFGIPWTAFAVFWMTMALKGVSSSKNVGPFIVFPLFGLPFVLIGVGMLTSPFWMRRKARRIAYIITDRRAIIFQGGWRGSVNVRSFEPAALRAEIQRKQYADGSGDVILTQEFRRGNKGGAYATNIGFMGVREVRNVEEMIRTLAQKGGPD